MDLIQGALADISHGQASLLIGRLRRNGYIRNKADRNARFVKLVRAAKEELPRPIKVEEDASEDKMADVASDSEANYGEVSAEVKVED